MNSQSKSKQWLVFSVLMTAIEGNAFASVSTSALASVIDNMQLGTWAKVNQNSFQSVWTPPEYRVGDNISGIIRAWSGFAWDSNRGEIILYGGGHANYAGNDVYTWNSSNLLWERASLPTKLQAPQATSKFGTVYLTVDNGATPQSAHTYDNNVYLPTLDRFLTFGGITYSSGGAPYLRQDSNGNYLVTGPYLFDPSKADGNKVGGATGTGVVSTTLGGNMWQNRDITSSLIGGGFGESISSVTQENGKDVVYVQAHYPNTYGNALFKYVINDLNNPGTDTFTLVGGPHSTTITSVGAGAIDPENRIFVRTGVNNFPIYGIGNVSYDFFYWNLDGAGGLSNTEKSFNVVDNTGGLFDFSKIANVGLQYDPIGKRFLLWGGGTSIFTLTHSGTSFDTGWVLGLDNDFANGGPGGTTKVYDYIADQNGILGKWDYASDYGVYVGLKDPVNGEVWVYKPSNYLSPNAVPVPSAIWLFLSSVVGLTLIGRRKKIA